MKGKIMAETKTTAKGNANSKKFKLSMPTPQVVLLLVVAFIVILTWIIPSGVFTPAYDGVAGDFADQEVEYISVGREMYGILDIF
jgi:uncharacterized ion transporter superfamily protein YfcC